MFLEIAIVSFMVGSFVYHRWFEEKPKAKPFAGINVPRTDEGAPIPLVYGRCRVRAPILAWSGNWTVTVTGKYELDMLFVVGIPFLGGRATLHNLYLGDARVLAAFIGASTTDFLASSSNPAISDTGEFGFFYDGSSTQQLSDGTNGAPFFTPIEHRMNLAGINGSLIPGYRNQIVVFLSAPSGSGATVGWSIGTTPNISSYGFEVRSLSTGTASDLGHSLADDADPAAVIYDLLTSSWGKLALSTSRIDVPSFQAASLTLFNEGHGYSRSIEQKEDASTLIDDVLRQVDGLIYEEPTTGKIVLKLVRGDYDPNALDDVNPDNAMLTSYSVRGWEETFNQVRITFTDRVQNYADAIAIGQNAANAVVQGGRLRSTDVHYIGCTTRSLAQQLAARELAVVSRPLAKATVVVNRSFYLKRPGDVVTLSWPQIGVSRMVMRIARVDLGQLHDGRITLDMIGDVFGVGLGAFPIP